VIKFVSDFSTGQWFSSGTPVSSTNNTDCHDITEILLKVALNTITHPSPTHRIINYILFLRPNKYGVNSYKYYKSNEDQYN
jgi:hypothetical protein